jgi:hypothetical protein
MNIEEVIASLYRRRNNLKRNDFSRIIQQINLSILTEFFDFQFLESLLSLEGRW